MTALSTAQARDGREVADAEALMGAFAVAKGGETILLQSGNYGDVKLNGLSFGNSVTLKSADGNMGAHFSTLKIANSSNIRVENVHVDWDSNGGRAVVEIQNSHGIEIVDSEVNGRVDSVYPIEGPIYGIYVFEQSSDVRIENTHVHDVKNGMTFFGIKDIALIENTVDRVGEDAFKFSQVVGGVIANNTGPSTFYPGKGAHADFMQFQGPGSKDLVITGNVFLPQNQFNAQGIFFGGEDNHANIVIENNIIYTGMVRGISLTASGEITVRDNTVINALNTDHPQSGILVTGINGAKVNIENNITSFRYGEYDGKNLLIQHTNKGGAFHYDDVFVNASASKGLTLTDLAPVPGSQAEHMGALQRWRELVE